MKLQEQVRKVNKPDEFYWCDLLHREEGYLVLRYDVTKDAHIGPFEIPAGALTIAHYRDKVAHVLWEMYDPKRALLGYCYHLCLPPEIGETHVEYLDLLVDLWFDPDGNLTVLDEDELAAAVQAGLVGKSEQELIACQRELIEREHPRIVESVWRPPGGAKGLDRPADGKGKAR